MAVTNFTPLLGLALPTTGDLSGTWGATVNTAITDLLDDAVAGAVTLTTDANVTLTTTNGADNEARNAIILCTGARTALRTITAPAQSKLYVIINATTGGFGVKIVGAGPTTGITVLAGTQVMVAWNGTDFVVSSGDVVGPASSTDNAITRFDLATGKLVQNSLVTVADDGAITAPQAGSVIPFYFANQAAFPSASTYHGALAHSHADGAMFFAHGSVWNRLLDDVTDVTVAQGGTGLSTLTANNVIIGNGTSSPLFVAPSTNGNVLTSNGTTWTSTAPGGAGNLTGAVTSVGLATSLGSFTSANLLAALTDETGTGANVFATSPTLVTPLLGTPTSGVLSSCTVDGTDAVGFRNIPQNSQSTAYTLVLADSGKHIFHPVGDNNARTFTIPANSSVAYPIGTALTFINMAVANVTIAITTDTLILSAAGTTGSRTLATNGSATCIKITSTSWLISGSGLT